MLTLQQQRAVKHNIPHEEVLPNQIFRLMKQQHRQCAYCKCILTLLTYSIDHILPLSLGGHHILSNIQLTCRDCNTKKRDQLNWKPREMRNFSYLPYDLRPANWKRPDAE